jgi:stage II sporulation protein R
LPKGYYSSLQIKIGEAEGKNWWCVMYPPLCLDASLAKGGYTDAENALVTKKYNVKFKILELISELGRY